MRPALVRCKDKLYIWLCGELVRAGGRCVDVCHGGFSVLSCNLITTEGSVLYLYINYQPLELTPNILIDLGILPFRSHFVLYRL